MATFRYEISLLVFNSTPHSWDIELNTRREISYLQAPMYFSLRNFLRISFTTDLMMTSFVFVFVIFPLLSCWISSANNLIWIFVTFVITIEVVSFWFGLFISVILIWLEMCNSHTSIKTFNSSPLLSDQHFDTHTRHKGDDQNAANRRQARSAITVRKSSKERLKKKRSTSYFLSSLLILIS